MEQYYLCTDCKTFYDTCKCRSQEGYSMYTDTRGKGIYHLMSDSPKPLSLDGALEDFKRRELEEAAIARKVLRDKKIEENASKFPEIRTQRIIEFSVTLTLDGKYHNKSVQEQYNMMLNKLNKLVTILNPQTFECHFELTQKCNLHVHIVLIQLMVDSTLLMENIDLYSQYIKKTIISNWKLGKQNDIRVTYNHDNWEKYVSKDIVKMRTIFGVNTPLGKEQILNYKDYLIPIKIFFPL